MHCVTGAAAALAGCDGWPSSPIASITAPSTSTTLGASHLRRKAVRGVKEIVVFNQ